MKLFISGGGKEAKLSPGDIDKNKYILGILVMALVTGAYTVIGGLKAVIITDVIQSVLMLIAGIILAFLMFSHPEIGGWAELRSMAFTGVRTSSLFNELWLPSLIKKLGSGSLVQVFSNSSSHFSQSVVVLRPGTITQTVLKLFHKMQFSYIC